MTIARRVAGLPSISCARVITTANSAPSRVAARINKLFVRMDSVPIPISGRRGTRRQSLKSEAAQLSVSRSAEVDN